VRWLRLSPFPAGRIQHGEQSYAALTSAALLALGVDLTRISIFPRLSFPLDECGPNDIAVENPEFSSLAANSATDLDYRFALWFASQPTHLEELRTQIERDAPEVIIIDRPWPWLYLRQLIGQNFTPKVIYCCRNRLASLEGEKMSGSDDATAELELEVIGRAAQIWCASDEDAHAMQRSFSKSAIFVPPCSTITSVFRHEMPRATDAGTRTADGRIAALIGCSCQPNVEGFFEAFEHGLGFLRPNEKLAIGGSLGSAILQDARYAPFRRLNDSRLQIRGAMTEPEKSAHYATAVCCLVPVWAGKGAKGQIADALAAGLPLVCTTNALRGYRSLCDGAVSNGIFIADEAAAFRALVIEAMRGHLAPIPDVTRALFQFDAMKQRIASAMASLKGSAINPP
jgi:hypothetical protein